MSNKVYKVFREPEWKRFLERERFDGSSDDEHDGFIHLSLADQVGETLAKHFAGESELVVAELSSELLGDALRFEKSRAGRDFPHLYGALAMRSVTRVWEHVDSERAPDLGE